MKILEMRGLMCLLIATLFVAPIMAMERNESHELECGCGEYENLTSLEPFQFSVMDYVPTLNAEPSEKPSIGDPPSYFSWMDYMGADWTTPAKYQGNCGSCWDFAAMGALESVINIAEGLPNLDPDLSEQYVLSCLPSAGSCKGGSPYWAFYLIKSTSADGNYYNGIIPESCMPYQANDAMSCDAKCDDWEEKLIPIADFGYWTPRGTEEDRQRIKTQIMEKGPVVSFILSTDDFTSWGLTHHSPDDYYPYPGYSKGVNHCIVILGWKDDASIPHGGYWICKNSWGSFWGYNGFFNIEYGALNVDNYRIVWVEYDSNAHDWSPAAEAGGIYVGDVGEQISFDGSKSRDDGNIVSWHWDFGDGGTSDEERPKHVYDERGIYDVVLSVRDEKGQEGIAKTAALIDTWNKGDEWVFDVNNIEVDTEYGGHITFSGNIENLAFEVAGEGNEYILDFNGKLRGDFSYESQPPMVLSGKFFFTKVKGRIMATKDLSLESMKASVTGIAMVRMESFSIPLPIPFKFTAIVDFSQPYAIFEFPLEEKTWSMPIVDINMDATASLLFGIINMPFQYNISLGALDAQCSAKQSITTKAGTFGAYKISIYDMLDFYFSPEIANIVKADFNYEGISMEAELVEVNYG